MKTFIRAYLRASTEDQDANRARASLDAFVAEQGLVIASYYVENESGARLQRQELFRLLRDSKPGDILLTEQVDRLSRLSAADWETLKAQIGAKRVRVVALDLPTSWAALAPVTGQDDLTQRIMDAMNAMLLDMLAAIARKDYDRRRRTAQGIATAKQEGKYKGRPEDVERNAAILTMLDMGASWSDVCKATGASRSTLSRLTRAKKQAAATRAA
jgi:DNA invertase Pin-like site-specific DNA recombinase